MENLILQNFHFDFGTGHCFGVAAAWPSVEGSGGTDQSCWSPSLPMASPEQFPHSSYIANSSAVMAD
jgi:hypothetical protein